MSRLPASQVQQQRRTGVTLRCKRTKVSVAVVVVVVVSLGAEFSDA